MERLKQKPRWTQSNVGKEQKQRCLRRIPTLLLTHSIGTNSPDDSNKASRRIGTQGKDQSHTNLPLLLITAQHPSNTEIASLHTVKLSKSQGPTSHTTPYPSRSPSIKKPRPKKSIDSFGRGSYWEEKGLACDQLISDFVLEVS